MWKAFILAFIYRGPLIKIEFRWSNKKAIALIANIKSYLCGNLKNSYKFSNVNYADNHNVYD